MMQAWGDYLDRLRIGSELKSAFQNLRQALTTESVAHL
jgi:hypothetical protein